MMSWLSKHIFKTKASLRLAYWLTVAISILFFIFTIHKIGWVQVAGWVYSLAFALSGLPQMIRSIKEGHSRGVADGTMLLWMTGEVAGLFYGFGLMELPIIFNCLLNTIFVGIIVKYRIFPRTKERDMI